MRRFEPRVVQMSLPSEFGYEKVAMLSAGAVAERMGFPPSRVHDLETAVSEACLNAIEHAHRQRASVKLIVTVRAGDSEIQVHIVDRGAGVIPRGKRPRIADKIEGREDSRGWGVFLIESLVDQVRVSSRRGGGKTLRLVLRLDEGRRTLDEHGSEGEFEGEDDGIEGDIEADTDIEGEFEAQRPAERRRRGRRGEELGEERGEERREERDEEWDEERGELAE